MARLVLKLENAVLRELALSDTPVTIGRLPDNTIHLDNLAVSGHHAKISWDKDHYEIEDLGSLNGTYVNNERVGKAKLRHCDMVKIGKHELEFKNEGPAVFSAIAAKTGPSVAKLEATVMLDTRQAQDMHAGKPFYAPAAMAAAATPAKERIGMLSVIEGKTDQEKYILTSRMNMIGKSQMASIKLKGFFAPTSAALISKRDNKYFIAPEHKVKLKINGEEVLSQRELAPGDVIEIGKMKAAFSYQD